MTIHNTFDESFDLFTVAEGDILDYEGDHYTVEYLFPFRQHYHSERMNERYAAGHGHYPVIVVSKPADERGIKQYAVYTSGEEVGDFEGCAFWGDSVQDAMALEMQANNQWKYVK